MKREVVVITGGSAGLGRAVAWEFARRGARIGLIAREVDGLKGAKREIESLGGKAIVLPADVSDFEAVEAAAKKVEHEFGPIDIWVNNAMASVFSPVKRTKPEEYKRVTEVTYLGVVYGTLTALRRMSRRNRGTIVQVGSALADRSIPLQSAYCAAKHAIAGFTDSLRCELIHDRSKVHLTMVRMPALNTPQFGWVKSRLRNKAQPVPPIFQPEVGAKAIYWAAHHRRREVYVGVPTVEAIVGNKFAPGLLDRCLGRTGYDSQPTSEPENPNRSGNLWKPIPGNHGAHDSFDSRVHDGSLELWADLNRWWIALGMAAATGAGVYLTKSRRSRESERASTKERTRAARPVLAAS
jgi:short-subunit dehydrogenase